ncbi:MAG: FadR family transcriptional regulator [Chloroflexi bacterium]|nr:FadR family transcriptional regulator [Chloroflexota bacterium]
MTKLLQRPALNQAIRDYVKQYILDQGLSAGDPLPSETQLAEELGVGRGSVREAIKALQSLGIIEVRRGDGLYVRPYTFDPILETLNYGIRFDTNTLAELAQIRVLLERAAIEYVVKQISTDDLDRLEALMDVWKERVQAGEPHRDLDEEFHRILYGTLNNQTFMNLFEVFWIAYENLDNPIIQDVNRLEEELENHVAILDAVKARDEDLARQHMMHHFRHLQERIRRATSLPDA